MAKLRVNFSVFARNFENRKQNPDAEITPYWTASFSGMRSTARSAEFQVNVKHWWAFGMKESERKSLRRARQSTSIRECPQDNRT